ncbi:MAG: hypothetical protein WBH14_12350, partial [Albidovulum sp.]
MQDMTGNRPLSQQMVALALVLLGSVVVVWAGLGTLRDTLMQWDLGLGTSPYWIASHAVQLYLITPAVTLATCFLLLGPGLVLSAVYGRTKHAAAWLISGL